MPAYLSWSAILAMPALAQASSLSPPGAPLTAMAPIVSPSTDRRQGTQAGLFLQPARSHSL
jgi:hypothetical protein